MSKRGWTNSRQNRKKGAHYVTGVRAENFVE